MGSLRVILGDQLSQSISSLDGIDPDDALFMMEVAEETTYAPHHKQKIALILSAMRHFAVERAAEGISTVYVRLDDPDNTGSFTSELKRWVKKARPDRIIITEPSEWRVREMVRGWQEAFGIPVEIREDDRFFASHGRFARWAEGRKSFRMEYFYREMRRETGLLMQGDEPAGGRWNFDHDNRKSLPRDVMPPPRQRFTPDSITQEVLDLVGARFAHHFGDLEPFGWAVTRADALEALDHFIAACLPRFGDYQDAMKRGEPFLFHAVLSPYLNIGLLTAREVCVAAEAAWRRGIAPLNAAEGFIRQVLGWREYVRGIYWLNMPGYAQTNALGAKRVLPSFYWTGETDLACIAETIADTRRNAYAHHIQRLMVTGNFALLAGIKPAQIEEWYLAVYADAFDWVELPNVHGMVMFADGGLLASKPYAASGAYINRMSDYCQGCRYDPESKSGPNACPFNLLYWNFLIENQAALKGNPRLAMPYRTLDKMSAERRQSIAAEATVFLEGMGGEWTGPQQLGLGI
jgi:deoxyribodipyrimidine photolyase-related protein